jgi:hypothetical protein
MDTIYPNEVKQWNSENSEILYYFIPEDGRECRNM